MLAYLIGTYIALVFLTLLLVRLLEARTSLTLTSIGRLAAYTGTLLPFVLYALLYTLLKDLDP